MSEALGRRRAIRTFSRQAGLGPVSAGTIILLDAALTHDSYVFEHSKQRQGVLVQSERLEFLGDAVLNLIVASQSYDACPSANEGTLSRRRATIVAGAALAQTASRLQVDKWLRLGKGEAAAHGERRPSILAATLEALIGAVYVGEGLPAARRFVERWHLAHADDAAAADPKTTLQEYVQARFKSAPAYALSAQSGPPHARTFTVTVAVRGKPVGSGSGSTKKRAESAAACEALARLRQ